MAKGKLGGKKVPMIKNKIKRVAVYQKSLANGTSSIVAPGRGGSHGTPVRDVRDRAISSLVLVYRHVLALLVSARDGPLSPRRSCGTAELCCVQVPRVAIEVGAPYVDVCVPVRFDIGSRR